MFAHSFAEVKVESSFSTFFYTSSLLADYSEKQYSALRVNIINIIILPLYVTLLSTGLLSQ